MIPGIIFILVVSLVCAFMQSITFGTKFWVEFLWYLPIITVAVWLGFGIVHVLGL